ncbi:TPA: ABC transporter permease [Bacillus cereus]|nr:ABC transporter permease [Bacillus cereus]
MFSIVKAELYKISKKKSFKTLIICLTILIIGNGIYKYFQESQNTKGWRNDLIEQNRLNEKELEKAKGNSQYPDSFVASVEKEIKKNDYLLSHNISPNNATSWEFVSFSSTFTMFILIFILVLSSESISKERSLGTLGLLFIRPYKRQRIYIGKLISIMLVGFLLVLYLFLLSLTIGMILFGIKGSGDMKMVEFADNITMVPIYKMILVKYISYCFTMCIFSIFAFSISILIHSNVFSIILSISLLLGGTTLTALVRGYSWSKYLYFTNMDLSIYLGDFSASINGATIEFTVLKYCLYSLLFILMSLIIFVKRDLKN